jgi:SAM-dependent methyltransferase
VAVAAAGVLLFVVEPLAGQLVLPSFGGGPGTWAATLAFFQLALLVGYGYARLTLRRLGPRWDGLVHVALAAAAVAVAAAAPGDPAALRPSGLEPALAVLVVHAASIGPAVVLLAATTPLLTGWSADARSDPAPGGDGAAPAHDGAAPAATLHRLYAVSNAGALVALLLYPTVLEPSLGLGATRRLWLAGLVAFAALVAALGLARARSGRAATPISPPRREREVDPGAPPARPRRSDVARWALLAALPAGLLTASTTLLTLDLGAVPLLWVLPLAVYLGTYVLAFSTLGDRLRRPAARFAPIAATLLWLPLAAGSPWSVGPLLAVVLGGLFGVALALHTALAAARPPDRELPGYYLAVATGGALGGGFAGIAAPLLLPDLWELPILLVAAILLGGWPTEGHGRRPEAHGRRPEGHGRRPEEHGRRPAKLDPQPAGLARPERSDRTPPRPPWFDAAVWRLNRYVVAGVVVLFLLVADRAPGADAAIAWFVAGAVVLAVGGHPAVLAGATAIVVAAALLATPQPNLFVGRSFFGVLEVRPSPDRSVVQLWNGTTLHGTQPIDPRRRLEPTGYYVESGPAGDLVRVLRGTSGTRLDVGVIGLGVGGLAAYAAPGDRWTFVEIDPLVVRIATDPRLFTYIPEARGSVEIVVDDGRLALARTPTGSLDLLVLDAFASDAIPTHLVTAEAIADALRTVRPGGLLAAQLSNRYYDLAPAVAGAAEAAGARILVRDYHPTEAELAAGAFPSRWLVATRSGAVLDMLARAGWTPVAAAPPLTDDRPNLLRFLRWSFG